MHLHSTYRSRAHGWRGRLERFAAGAALLLATACATNPATGERQLALISESQEIEMGRSYSQQIDQTMPIYDDPDLQAYVSRIGLSLAATSERPDLPWRFTVLDDPVVNAFALPGGFLYVTRGILAHFNSEAELAAVLGHEIGHVTARHSVEQMSRQQLFGGALVLGSILSEDVARFGGVGQAALGVLFLSYGRDDEHQADGLGVRYALRDGYDPREAIHVHEMLSRQTELRGGRGTPSWLSTHPSSADRIDRIRAQVDTIPPTRLANTVVDRPEMLSHVDGIVYGMNPRQGYFEGARFNHPDLAFRIDMPSGWATANLATAVLARSPQEDAIIELSVASTSGHQAAAQAFFSQEGIRSSGVGSQSVNGNPATIGRFDAATQNGTVSGIAAFLDYGGTTYRILGYTPQQQFGTYSNAFRATISSFDRLTDRAALSVQPMRVNVITVQRTTTLEQMATSSASPISPEELAILNGIDLDAQLAPGTRIKWVEGTPPPGS